LVYLGTAYLDRSIWTDLSGPVYLDPAYLDPAYLDPVYLDPVYLDPVYLDPVYLDPGYPATWVARSRRASRPPGRR